MGEECSICLEPMNEPKKLALLPCAHMFHTHCIHAVVKQLSKCPHCNAEVRVSQLASVVMELQSKPAPPPTPVRAAPQQELTPALRAHGSKLNAIAKRLHDIRADDAEA